MGCLLLSLAATIAGAADVSFPELEDNIPGHADVTYLDLAKLIVPDLAKVAGGYQGHVVIDLRHIDGPDSSEKPPETIVNPGIARCRSASAAGTACSSLLDLGESVDTVADFAVLALYDVSAKPLLLDAADVGYDRSSYFRDPATLAVAEGTDAIVTMSTHFNSSQGYVTSALILPRNDRFELIDTVFTFDEKNCAFSAPQNPVFKVLAADRRRLRSDRGDRDRDDDAGRAGLRRRSARTGDAYNYCHLQMGRCGVALCPGFGCLRQACGREREAILAEAFVGACVAG